MLVELIRMNEISMFHPTIGDRKVVILGVVEALHHAESATCNTFYALSESIRHAGQTSDGRSSSYGSSTACTRAYTSYLSILSEL